MSRLDSGGSRSYPREPRNALVKQYQRMFELDGVRLTFTDGALREIASEAMSRGTRARGCAPSWNPLLREQMFEIPSRNDVRGSAVR